MREFKFRSFCKDTNQMLYEVQKNYNGCIDDFIAMLSLNDEYEIMQYTGKKDLNGKDIYEGDIVKCYSREKWAIETGVDSKLVLYGTGEVVWFESECGFGIKGQDPTFLGWYECFEIIGNIYENQELLK